MRVYNLVLYKVPIDRDYKNVFDMGSTVLTPDTAYFTYERYLKAVYPYQNLDADQTTDITKDVLSRSISINDDMSVIILPFDYVTLYDYNYMMVRVKPADEDYNCICFFIEDVESINSGNNPSSRVYIRRDEWTSAYFYMKENEQNFLHVIPLKRSHFERFSNREGATGELAFDNFNTVDEFEPQLKTELQNPMFISVDPDTNGGITSYCVCWLRIELNEPPNSGFYELGGSNKFGYVKTENGLSYSELRTGFFPYGVWVNYNDINGNARTKFFGYSDTVIDMEVQTLPVTPPTFTLLRYNFANGDYRFLGVHNIVADDTYISSASLTYDMPVSTNDFSLKWCDIDGNASTTRGVYVNMQILGEHGYLDTAIPLFNNAVYPALWLDCEVQNITIDTANYINYRYIDEGDTLSPTFNTSNAIDIEPIMNQYPYVSLYLTVGDFSISLPITDTGMYSYITITRFVSGGEIKINTYRRIGTRVVLISSTNHTYNVSNNGIVWSAGSLSGKEANIITGGITSALSADTENNKLARYQANMIKRFSENPIDRHARKVVRSMQVTPNYKNVFFAVADTAAALVMQERKADTVIRPAGYGNNNLYAVDAPILTISRRYDTPTNLARLRELQRYGYIYGKPVDIINGCRKLYDYCEGDIDLSILTNYGERDTVEGMYYRGFTRWHLDTIASGFYTGNYKERAKNLDWTLNNPERKLV